MPLSVISFEDLAKPLMNFWHTRHFCLFRLNLPFSYYNRHLSRFPSLLPQLRFCQTLMDSCPVPRFLKFAIFAKIVNCQYASFVAKFAKYAIFVKPTIIDMPLLSSCLNFCQICHFYKIVICQDDPFCHLI